ncbi:MAG TPA: glycosyltransferase family 9 protein [Rubrivivax sp.]|nr:glycosyltransferase family 9 protein [Rubrivivax sp.]
MNSIDPRWASVKRLLVLRLDGLGDVLMTTPALAALRAGFPDAHITLLAAPAAVELAPHLPAVDEVLPMVVPWMPAAAPAAGSAASSAASIGQGEPAHDQAQHELQALDRLRAGAFDAAIIFTVCTQSALPAALWCRLAGIRLRLATARENPYGLLTDWLPETDVIGGKVRHEVQRQIDLLAHIGVPAPSSTGLQVRVLNEDRRSVALRLRACGIGAGRRVVVLHPGANAESRRWPAERFGAVAEAIATRTLCAVVLAGGRGDVALATRAQQAMASPQRCTVLAGVLSLGETVALIERASLLICNNSLPAHLAAALGTPLVALYALTNPQHTPWQAAARVLSHDVDCRWCLKSRCPQQHHACLRGVMPEEVADAALSLLLTAPPRTLHGEAHA